MNWADVLKIVSAAMLSVGGAGGIIVIVVKFASTQIEKRLEQKYAQKLEKELEKYKSLLGEKTYVTKARFDTEFQAFKDINKEIFDVTSTYIAYANGLNEALTNGDFGYFERSMTQNELSRKTVNLMDLRSSIEINAAFLETDILDKYLEIQGLCIEKSRHFAQCLEEAGEVKPLDAYSEDLRVINQRTNTIKQKTTEVYGLIRNYLDSITVIG